MGNPRGVRRDFAALEQRRLEGLRLLKQGLNQSEVARRLHVCSQSVSRWAQTLEQSGEKGLRAAGRAGRLPLLDTRQRQRLEKLLLEGPEKLGYETPLWTCPRVADLIEREFGGALPCRPCLETAPAVELESATTEGPGSGTQ